jgi:hypothetical protein
MIKSELWQELTNDDGLAITGLTGGALCLPFGAKAISETFGKYSEISDFGLGR